MLIYSERFSAQPMHVKHHKESSWKVSFRAVFNLLEPEFYI